FITRNGGSSWTKLYYSTNSNPSRIYMYNERIGFMMTNDNQTLKTTNGGNNWFQSIAEPYTDIHFVDSLTGWKANGFIKKTTDGGINWISQNLPNVIGGIYTLNRISKFSFTMRDTIWGTLGYVDFPNGQERGIIYKTTNSGINWGYQIPDTSIVIYQYDFNCFTNKLNGWAYSKYNNRGGIHTTVGGDSTIYTGINNNITFLSKEFLLYQNYPNPFNSITNVKV
ncbi:MAG: hypothetical protein NTU73_10205, partial [Ignavibacteriae bacterium]|nr:hypothetical protein [Ignavibacteriota bacterium]